MTYEIQIIIMSLHFKVPRICVYTLSYAEGNYHLNFQYGFSKELYRFRAVFGLEKQV